MIPGGRRLLLVGCGAVLSACAAAWFAQGDQTVRVRGHLALFAAAFAAYLLALRASRGLSARGLRWCLAAALGWRLLLVPAPPLLSDDVYRSLWEGRIQNAGGNPYAWADRPEADKWAALRDDTWRHVNHRDYTAIYPPLWQWAARGVVAAHDAVWSMKLFLVGCEVLAWWPLALCLRRARRPRERLLVAAWSPVALVEIAGSGHNEPLGMLLLCGALFALAARRPALAAMCAGLGAAAKLLPALVAAAWARRFRWWHVLAPVALVVLLFSPFAAAGPGLWRSLRHYGRFWRFNESLFAPLAWLGGSHEAGLRLALGLLAATAFVLAWRRTEPAAAGLTVVGAGIALAPNVLPWYALWLLPFLALRAAFPLLLLTGTLQLAYLVYPGWLAGEPWHLGWRVRIVEYGAPLALTVWHSAARARTRNGDG